MSAKIVMRRHNRRGLDEKGKLEQRRIEKRAGRKNRGRNEFQPSGERSLVIKPKMLELPSWQRQGLPLPRGLVILDLDLSPAQMSADKPSRPSSPSVNSFSPVES